MELGSRQGVGIGWVSQLFDTRRHLMFYEAVAEDDTRSIGLAVSEDGKTGWKRLDRYPNPHPTPLS